MNQVIMFIWVLLTVNLYLVHCSNNCVYNRCEYRKNPSSYSGHAPCMGTGSSYKLIRTIECHNEDYHVVDEDYHVCCKDPLRQDIQQSRQAVFRQVAKLGEVFSETCTKLVLCEQGCKDRVNSQFERSDYPSMMAGDNQSQRDYVMAYNRGENVGICDKPGALSDHINSVQYCNQLCYASYGADCQPDLDRSRLVRFYHNWARVFHKCGMTKFGALWAVRDQVEVVMNKVNNMARAIRTVAEDILNMLHNLKTEFQDGLNERGNVTDMRRKRSVDIDSEWHRFLQTKNTTSHDMIDFLANMTWSQFNNFTSTFNQTLLDININVPGLNETWLNDSEDIIH